MFPAIAGRDAQLTMVRRALQTGEHIILVGPPAAGKSEVLRAIERRRGGEYVDGSRATAARLSDLLADDPARLLIDEADDLGRDAWRALAVPLEGRVVVETARESTDEAIGTHVVCAANDDSGIPSHLRSRLIAVNFPAYSAAEFADVCAETLPGTIGWVDPDAAQAIAQAVYEAMDSTDPRDARQVARLAWDVPSAEAFARQLAGEDVDVPEPPAEGATGCEILKSVATPDRSDPVDALKDCL